MYVSLCGMCSIPIAFAIQCAHLLHAAYSQHLLDAKLQFFMSYSWYHTGYDCTDVENRNVAVASAYVAW